MPFSSEAADLTEIVPLLDENYTYRNEKVSYISQFKQQCSDYMSTIHWKMVFVFFFLLIVATLNRVLFKIMTNSAAFYISPSRHRVIYHLDFTFIIISLIPMPFSWVITWYYTHITNKIPRSSILDNIPKFIGMSLLDSISALLFVLGGSQTSGPLQLLLLQASIPMTLTFCYLFTLPWAKRLFGRALDIRYRWQHIIGASLVTSGILVAVVPSLISNSTETSFAYAIVFFCNLIPSTLTLVYKDLLFKNQSMDYTLLIFKGAKCFIGISSLGPDMPNLCRDRYYGITAVTYSMVNLVYNYVAMYFVQHGSASFYSIALALMLPLSNMAFTLPSVMNIFPKLPDGSFPSTVKDHDTFNNYTTPVTKYDYMGLAVIITGMILYYSLPERDTIDECIEDKQPLL